MFLMKSGGKTAETALKLNNILDVVIVGKRTVDDFKN